VGIDNAQKDRIKEYLPYPSLHPPILRPRGKRYPDFLLNEIMPFIAKEYRVATGPENTGIGGSSLGAIISLFTAIQCPGVFGRLLLESPSLFISNRRLLNRSRTIRVWPARVFMAIGTRETGNERRDERFVGYVRRLEHILRRAGLQQDRLAVTLDEGAVHSEGEWAKRFPQALEFLYGKSHPH
jgi:predicted alpha/beta superfamily hydrolase